MCEAEKAESVTNEWWPRNEILDCFIQRINQHSGTDLPEILPQNIMYASKQVEAKASSIEGSGVLQVFEKDEEVNVIGRTGDYALVATSVGRLAYLPIELLTDKPSMEFLGVFTITHYCPCATCNGDNNRVASSGDPLTDGVTIAVDPSVIPKGKKVFIEGYGERIAQDTGGGVTGAHIDMFVDTSHEHVLEMGKVERKVYLINE